MADGAAAAGIGLRKGLTWRKIYSWQHDAGNDGMSIDDHLDRSSVVIEQTIQTSTHGRYLVHGPASADPAPILVGFHGYGEDAERQLDRLRAISGSDRWLLVSIQGLHRFYHRSTNAVVASWMTRQDRELAMADNRAYVSATLRAVAESWSTMPRVVFAGFSQGV